MTTPARAAAKRVTEKSLAWRVRTGTQTMYRANNNNSINDSGDDRLTTGMGVPAVSEPSPPVGRTEDYRHPSATRLAPSGS